MCTNRRKLGKDIWGGPESQPKVALGWAFGGEGSYNSAKNYRNRLMGIKCQVNRVNVVFF